MLLGPILSMMSGMLGLPCYVEEPLIMMVLVVVIPGVHLWSTAVFVDTIVTLRFVKLVAVALLMMTLVFPYGSAAFVDPVESKNSTLLMGNLCLLRSVSTIRLIRLAVLKILICTGPISLVGGVVVGGACGWFDYCVFMSAA